MLYRLQTFIQLLDVLLQIKYKQLAEMEKANFTSVVDTPEIIHAQQVKNLSSQVSTFIRISLTDPIVMNRSLSINIERGSFKSQFCLVKEKGFIYDASLSSS